jgi:acetyl esterase/lipase/glyoxylase-like metal-dependent hydrolase (beta-lactamase superfamily II)
MGPEIRSPVSIVMAYGGAGVCASLLLLAGLCAAALPPMAAAAEPVSTQAAASLPVQVTEEGQHVAFDGYTWQRRELSKRLPIDQPWPDEGKIGAVLAQYGLDKLPIAEFIPTPARILPDVYLVNSQPNHTYLIDAGADGLALIDPGLPTNVDSILANIERLGFSRKQIKWVLNTHAHFDHSMADSQFRHLGAKILIGEADADAVEKGTRVTAKFMLPQAMQDAYPTAKVDWRLSDGEEVRLGNKVLHVIHTPGHTEGSSCFLLQIGGSNILFSGDTLLYDYRLGAQGTAYADNRAYVASLQKLAQFHLGLTDQLRWDVLLSGHGALVLDRAYMDIEKGWRTVQIDLLEGRQISALPFATDSYRKLMFGRPAMPLAPAGPTSNVPASVADMHLANADIPFSDLASPEAATTLGDILKAPQVPDFSRDIEIARRFYGKFNDDRLARMRQLYAVTVQPEKIGGVRVDTVMPSKGVSAGNQSRVLLNLHGGAFMWGSGSGGLVESVPIAATAGIKVISVDYRMAPEYQFPAASEDVATVYRELLKSYRPENIGIYGCSAGGILTAEAVAWFQTHDLPKPGAIATLCATGAELLGDSSYVAPLLTGAHSVGKPVHLADAPYFKGVNPQDPLALPIASTAALAKFPPTLLIAGSRDFSVSSITTMHRKLEAVGVHSELYVFDGLWHAFFVYPDLPESRETYAIIDRFFAANLGSQH